LSRDPAGLFKLDKIPLQLAFANARELGKFGACPISAWAFVHRHG
jgi:hypothetical protein